MIRTERGPTGPPPCPYASGTRLEASKSERTKPMHRMGCKACKNWKTLILTFRVRPNKSQACSYHSFTWPNPKKSRNSSPGTQAVSPCLQCPPLQQQSGRWFARMKLASAPRKRSNYGDHFCDLPETPTPKMMDFLLVCP